MTTNFIVNVICTDEGHDFTQVPVQRFFTMKPTFDFDLGINYQGFYNKGTTNPLTNTFATFEEASAYYFNLYAAGLVAAAASILITAGLGITFTLGKLVFAEDVLQDQIDSKDILYYEGTLKKSVIPLVVSATVGASGLITFDLTKNASAGDAAFSEVYPETSNLSSTNGIPYQPSSWSVAVNLKSITMTLKQPGTVGILGGSLSYVNVPSGTTVNLTILGKSA